MNEASAATLLSIHNTRFLVKFMEEMRESILNDNFVEFYNNKKAMLQQS